MREAFKDHPNISLQFFKGIIPTILIGPFLNICSKCYKVLRQCLFGIHENFQAIFSVENM